MVQILQLLIRFYQRTLSPDHGWLRGRYPYGFCRFHPSCSEYAHKAIGQHGVLKGGYLVTLRLVRCNPWSQPAVDQVPSFKLTDNHGPSL